VQHTIVARGYPTDPVSSYKKMTRSLLVWKIMQHAVWRMDNDMHNFITKLAPTPNIRVRGDGNQLMEAKGKGTVLWKIEDGNKVVHEKLFPGTIHIPELKLCLLSPQPRATLQVEDDGCDPEWSNVFFMGTTCPLFTTLSALNMR
jgi:hypothetical protein